MMSGLIYALLVKEKGADVSSSVDRWFAVNRPTRGLDAVPKKEKEGDGGECLWSRGGASGNILQDFLLRVNKRFQYSLTYRNRLRYYTLTCCGDPSIFFDCI